MNAKSSETPPPPGQSADQGHYIYRPYRTDKRTGEVLWAKNYGLKAWKIWIADDRPSAANDPQPPESSSPS